MSLFVSLVILCAETDGSVYVPSAPASVYALHLDLQTSSVESLHATFEGRCALTIVSNGSMIHSQATWLQQVQMGL